MMLTGAHVPAKKALDMGIIDGISNDVVNESIGFIKNKVESNEDHPKVRDLNSKMIEARGDDKVLLEAHTQL
jgi:enoyl-CoA hydratase/carnithine racemase